MSWNNGRELFFTRPFGLLLIVLLLSWPLTCVGTESLKAFPPAEEGMVRYVLQLPAHDDETLYRLELIVGQRLLLDAENLYRLGGQLEREIIEGWGYSRYLVKTLGPVMGTLMAVDPAKAKVERFVTIGAEPYLIPYNSRLPVVVYVPAGAEVHYRLWSAAAATLPMDEG